MPVETDDLWHPARLIPISGISGEREREKRATSALLAVLRGVPELGRELLRYLGAPAGRISTFLEIPLRDEQEALFYPDRAILVEGQGGRLWRCLVEVKTGRSNLERSQVEAYLRIARAHRFDAVLTISNQIVSRSEESPLPVPARLQRGVSLRHLSWFRLLTMAVVLREHTGIADADRAWILDELIAYLQHPNSGASGFEDLGGKWASVREAARRGTLRSSDPGALEVAERWDEFVQHLCLGLRQELGREVRPEAARGQDRAARIAATARELAEEGKLRVAIRVPDAAGSLELTADVRSRLVTTGVEIKAPREGGPRGRIGWLLRQLRSLHYPDVRVDVRFTGVREPTSLPLAEARANPAALLCPSDRRREPRLFRVEMTREMQTKAGAAPGSFVHATRRQTIDFYRDVLQGLRPWAPSAPRLPAEEPSGSPAAPGAGPETSVPAPSAGGDSGYTAAAAASQGPELSPAASERRVPRPGPGSDLADDQGVAAPPRPGESTDRQEAD